MNDNQTTVSDVFRRAQVLRGNNPNSTFKQIREMLVGEFSGKPFPATATLTIPEQDALVPEEDWSAGLPIVMRGIQMEDWKEIVQGVVICLEQVENYVLESGAEQTKRWHDRTKGIGEQTKKSVSKWLPEDLMRIAEKSQKR